MPYVRKLAGHKVMSGLDVIIHVMRVDQCDHKQAVKQILQATQDDRSWWLLPGSVGSRSCSWEPGAWHFEDEVLKRWPEPDAAGQAIPEGACPVPPDVPTRPAPPDKIHKAIKEVYDEEAAAGRKPPNLEQIAKPTQEKLKAVGLSASGRQIKELASSAEHAIRRLPIGKTVASDKSRQISH
jgi:hypothetical protein